MEKENSRGPRPRLVENQRKENLATMAKPGGRKTLPLTRRKPGEGKPRLGLPVAKTRGKENPALLG